MKIVIDTNVILDVLGVRQPFFEHSKAVMQLAAQGKITGAMTANTVTDIAYLLGKHMEADAVRAALMGLMDMLEVLEVNRELCFKAFELPMSDYEDALLAACADHWKADGIVTRNLEDFTNSPIQATTPEDFLKNGCFSAVT